MLTGELLGEALDLVPDAIVITDAAGRIVFANSRVEALLGYAPRELVGREIETLLPPELRARHAGHRARYMARPEVRPMGTTLDLAALHKDGREVPVEISLSPIRNDAGQGLTAAALRDASARRRARGELVDAREAADRANLAKSRFLATASHDLRQPLQALALLNGALRRMIVEPEAAEALAHQEQAIGAASRLLNALLDISKLESGAIHPEIADFDLSGLLEEVRRDFADVAANKGLTLRSTGGDEVARTDRSLLGQILRNLVSNAVKYTASGAVELRCAATARQLWVEVADTGIGIDRTHFAHIFDEFFQVGVASNTSREGYGLGLSIVRRVAALLSLPIEVESQPGRGTTFRLGLKRGAAPAGAGTVPARTGERAAAPRHHPQVLLVDDDAGVRDATAMLLKVGGYRVITAASRGEAAALARAEPGIALLVTDYHLSEDATGIQVIADVRAILGRPLPAVLMTGDTSGGPRVDGPAENVHRVSKPVNAEDLLALLGTLLP